MPPRPSKPTLPSSPDWSALLMERAQSTKADPSPALRRHRGPASLAEAIHRFVDRNWD